MERYDSYKDSGFEWMGLIPSNWKLTKNRYGFQKYKNGNNESDDTSVLSLTIRGVKVKTNLSFGKSTESYIGHQLVEEGDIVFTPRDFDQTPILSDVSKYNGCISNLYIVDKTKDGVLNHFVNYYWYGLKYSVDYFKNFSHGIRYSFNRFQFDEIPLLLPPLSEQQQIVSFLDTKISLIDSLIEKTQRKIELLKEKRTSLINEVVTKGLNPNVEMKDSGVEWIGEIPSGWKVKKVSYLCSQMISGPFGSSLKKEFYTKSGYKIYGQEQVIKDDFEYGDYYVSEEKYQELKRCQIYTDDILVSCVGTFGKISKVPKEFEPGIINPRLLKITPNKLISSNYFLKLLRSNISFSQFELLSRGGTMGVINLDILSRLVFPIPTIIEQQQIVEYLDEQTQLIDNTISIEEKRIELLKEYRQSIISEVVTGKLKVVE